jgi:cysteinyl-tRNA synthetase
MTEITLWNTRTREKAPFRPIDPANVRMYVCGPTVYDRAHIGNARPAVVFDVLFRLLRHAYGPEHVTYVRNLTDVDDKINARAAEVRREGESLEAAVRRITDETIGWYHEDMAALGVLPPTHEPRATEYIPEMIAMIERLIAEGHAYVAEGHVLFSVATYDRYGALSRRPLDEMAAGARVEVAPYKRDPMDFVLWKPSTPEQPGWESPWGRGRPGWHIECSAMAKALLGDVFDIHAGGIDLQFPHHENEVAQSCCANHTERMANHWLHNGYLMVEGEKMSKSLGNFFTVKDLCDRGIPGEVIRYVLLSKQYRYPLDWTEEKVEEATRVINRWRRALDTARVSTGHEADGQVQSETLRAALSKDLDTKNALGALDLEAKRILGPAGPLEIKDASRKFLNGLNLLGFEDISSARDQELEQNLTLSSRHRKRIEVLLSERLAARKAKDFSRADAIRDGLIAAGVEVKDTPQGTEWSLTRSFDPAKLAELEANT